jgi:glutamate racemase
MKNNNYPIGLFDSGVGGTSIWKEVITLLPHEDTIYLSDSKNAPYGEKSTKKIIKLCEKNIAFLLNKECKLIIVACNTATTNAISFLRNKYNVPFIGIEPAIKPAALLTKTNTIGVLATKGTLNSTLFEKTSSTLPNGIKVKEMIGKGLVALIENGDLHSEEMTYLLNLYLKPMRANNIDSLVLGCTHFPYLVPQIREIIGPEIQIIDSGEAVAKQTKAILAKNQLLNDGIAEPSQHTLFINKDKKALVHLLLDMTNPNIKIIQQDF